MVKTQAWFLPLVTGISDSIEYGIFLEGKCQETAEHFNLYGFMRGGGGGAKTSTLNFRAVGVFGSPQDNEDIFAFSDLLCVCSLKNASWILSCFLISTNVKDVFDC